MPSANPNSAALLDKYDVAAILNCTPRAVTERLARGQIPVRRIKVPGDARLLFSADEFHSWIADRILGTGKPGHVTVEHENGISRTVARTADGTTSVSFRGSPPEARSGA